MIINSDFRDTYDIYSKPKTDKVFNRYSNGGPTKRQQFEILKQIGCKIPPIGLVGEVYEKWWEDEKVWIKAVVAYEDETKHCGEGKTLVSSRQMKHIQPSMGHNRPEELERDRLWGLFCSAYVGNSYNTNKGRSRRYLQIGRHYFWIEYQSSESWMSNVGQGTTELVDWEFNKCEYKYDLPIYAIDFVTSAATGNMFAVDFNISPGIGNILQSVMTYKDIYEEIERNIKC